MYLYELHTHTSEVSSCSRIDAESLVKFYAEQGFSGICITDHFFNGNTLVPADLPWKERIERFLLGYQKAKRAGEEIGIDVFFAWEYSYFCTDFLTFGLDEAWLLNHPDCLTWTTREYCRKAREDGAYVVHAHPFREAHYIEMIRLMPREVDAVETINACRTTFENEMANHYAESYGLPKFASSDNHLGRLPYLAALSFETPKHTLSEIISALRNNEHTLQIIYPGE